MTMDVVILQDLDLDYCRELPFHLSMGYPEYTFGVSLSNVGEQES